jgi:hypothetical protein
LERGERLTLPPQLNFITLACRDVERMAEFIRALDWPESSASERKHGSLVDQQGHLTFDP